MRFVVARTSSFFYARRLGPRIVGGRMNTTSYDGLLVFMYSSAAARAFVLDAP